MSRRLDISKSITVTSIPMSAPMHTSETVWMFVSILLSATSIAIMQENTVTVVSFPSSAMDMNIENASAVCPLGIPPWKYVPFFLVL